MATTLKIRVALIYSIVMLVTVDGCREIITSLRYDLVKFWGKNMFPLLRYEVLGPKNGKVQP